MTHQMFTWFVLTVCSERLAELIVSSKIFEPIRLSVKRWAYPLDTMPNDDYYTNFKISIDYLLTCGYCVSVWTSYAMAFIAPSIYENMIINWCVSGLFIHGMANLYHVLYELLRRGRIHTYDLLIKRASKSGE